MSTELGFKILDCYVGAEEELSSFSKNHLDAYFIEINPKQLSELCKFEQDILRYFSFAEYPNFLDLDSEFRVLTTSTVNPEVQSLISDYEGNWDNSKYVKEIKSFLEQDKTHRNKLLSYIDDFTLLPDTHLDEVDEFINSHLSTMAKVILSIRERDGNFVLREAECIFRWESWKHLSWILRDVRDNEGKWMMVDKSKFFNSVELTIPSNFLEGFLRYLIVVTKLDFEDNVYLLTNSPSFNQEVKLVDLTNNEELNEFNSAKVEMESLFAVDWKEGKTTVPVNSKILNSKRYVSTEILDSKRYVSTKLGFKILDCYVGAEEELSSFNKNHLDAYFTGINPKQLSELCKFEQDILRYFSFAEYPNFLDLDSEFRVLTTSTVNPEVQSLISDYEGNWDNSKYVKEIKSFLEQDKTHRNKLLSYIDDFTLLPDTHLDEVDEFINSHLSTMAKVILSIRERDGNFVLREAECIFRWESWKHLSWILRDVRDNEGKWMMVDKSKFFDIVVDKSKFFNSVELTIPSNFLEGFLRYLIVVTKLDFEDNVYLLTNSPSFNQEVKLVDLTNNEELNEFNSAKVEMESLFAVDWKEGKTTLISRPKILISRPKIGPKISVQQREQSKTSQDFVDSSRRTLKEVVSQIDRIKTKIGGWDESKLDSDLKLEIDRKKLNQDRENLNSERSKLDSDRSKLDDERSKLNSDRENLDDERLELDSTMSKLNDDRKNLDDERSKLNSDRENLDDERLELDSTMSKLNDDRKNLDDERSKLNSDRENLDDERLELKQGKESLSKDWIKLKKEQDRFKQEKEKLSQAQKEYRESLIKEQTQLESFQAQVDRNRENLTKSRSELDSTMSKLNDDRKNLDDERSKLNSDRENLDDERLELDSARSKLDDERSKLNSDRENLDDERLELDSARSKLDDERSKLNSDRENLDDERLELDSARSKLDDERSKLNQDRKNLNSDRENLDDERLELDSARSKLDDERSKLNQDRKNLNSDRENLDDERLELDSARSKLDDERSKLNQDRKNLNSDRENLDDERLELDSARSKLDDERSKLNSDRENLDDERLELDSARSKLDDERSKLGKPRRKNLR